MFNDLSPKDSSEGGSTPPESQRIRRESPRIRLKIPLHYRAESDPEHMRKGWTKDISAFGMSFLTESRLEIGSGLKLFLDELPGNDEMHRIKAVVVRTAFELHHSDGLYDVGVKFVDLDQESRKLISDALQQSDMMALLQLVGKEGASDLHLSANHPPIARVAGKLRPIREEKIPGSVLKDMIYTIIGDNHRRIFEEEMELNFAVSVSDALRYRANVHMQRGNVEAAFRRIEPMARSFSELRLPAVLKRFGDLKDGLILITGPTGAGKTTTAASIIDYINQTRAAVIITLENPIEYIYVYKKSLIKQREIGVDTHSFPAALRECMRQDPDVIVIGEVRDEETMAAALDAAETGHLVIATFPAANCVQTILRTFHYFHRERQQEVQLQLANCLRGIISLRLLPRADKPGVVPATEVLTCTDAIANMIRTASLEQVASAIQTGSSHGMHSLNMSLEKLRQEGLIDTTTARLASLARVM